MVKNDGCVAVSEVVEELLDGQSEASEAVLVEEVRLMWFPCVSTLNLILMHLLTFSK